MEKLEKEIEEWREFVIRDVPDNVKRSWTETPILEVDPIVCGPGLYIAGQKFFVSYSVHRGTKITMAITLEQAIYMNLWHL